MTPSIRIILGSIIAMMGLLALFLAMITGSVHKELVLENNRAIMQEQIRLKAIDLLEELKSKSQDLGLSLQRNSDFRTALQNKSTPTLITLLNNQFHQYFVTANIIDLRQLVVMDKNFQPIAEATDGALFIFDKMDSFCSATINRAKQRQGRDRLKIFQETCLYNKQALHIVIVPVGGLRIKGFLMIITDPIQNLAAIEASLGLPLKIQSTEANEFYVSENWPSLQNSENTYSAYHTLMSSDNESLLTISINQDLQELSEDLFNARLLIFLFTGAGTLIIVIFSIWLLRKTTLIPLDKLTHKIKQVHQDQSKIGEQLTVEGTKEIRVITRGFNEMSHEMENLYELLENMAYTDSLTKLPNRNLFQNRLQETILNYQSSKEPFALLLLDLDKFKAVNDTHGHHAGDELLKEVSVRLHNTLRNDDIVSFIDNPYIDNTLNDTVARLGGDEFAIICTGTGAVENTPVIAEKIIHALKQPFHICDHDLSVGASIGIALCPVHSEDINALVKHADVAMYLAKNTDRGYCIYEKELDK